MTNDVLAVAEHRRGELRDVSFELITVGRNLAEQTGGEFHVVTIGDDVDAFSDQLNRDGVDVIHTVSHDVEFNHDIYTQVVEQLHRAVDPQALLMPHTVNGMDYAPAIAGQLDLPLVTDVIDIDTNDGLTVTRELYGSKVETTLAVAADQYALTVRPTEWEQTESPGNATTEPFEAAIDDSRVRTTVTGFEEMGGGDVDIAEADFIISIGRGIQEQDNLPLIEKLCEATGATLAASRPIVDNEWLPKNRQVGQSGKVVQPEVYIAIGISGAVQHIAGMKDAGTIIAINNDSSAPIFDVADYGIVDDLFEVVPQLIEEFGGDSNEL
jgi:electron transfer flavoprotein alpha subunit